eukprot:NODE_844_length_1156_cov_83.531584_g802_i0.p1 GENE.NODE_844_length_1156_cov_83.531584_g802_i0~~NODE_844_length_1156_cov_83.531584_g802_i0.p1  ORF type:complete len:207 (+),score=35.76 NODE_844_length_1156_cov_83.531584_g802_i0:205-825(+)
MAAPSAAVPVSVLLEYGEVELPFDMQSVGSSPQATAPVLTALSHELGVNAGQMECLTVNEVDAESSSPVGLAVRLASEHMSVQYFKHILAENLRLQARLQKMESAVSTLSAELEQTNGKAEGAEANATALQPRPPMSKLESNNRTLQAEIDHLRTKLAQSEKFKRDVLVTVKDLKKQLATLTEEVLLTEWETDEPQDDSEEEADRP